MAKTKIMRNLGLGSSIRVDGVIRFVSAAIMTPVNSILDQDLYGAPWENFTSLNRLSQPLKRKIFNQCVLPVLTYVAAETKQAVEKIRTTQQKRERSMTRRSLKDRVANKSVNELQSIQNQVTIAHKCTVRDSPVAYES